MIQGVSESTAATLNLTSSVRDRVGTKAGPEEPVGPERGSSGRDRVTQDQNGKGLDSREFAEVVAQVQETLKQVEPRVQLSVDSELNRVIVKVVESDSGELIRQIPPEEVLRVQRFLNEHSGLLLTEEA